MYPTLQKALKKNVKHIAVVRKELVENTALKSMKDKLN